MGDEATVLSIGGAGPRARLCSDPAPTPEPPEGSTPLQWLDYEVQALRERLDRFETAVALKFAVLDGVATCCGPPSDADHDEALAAFISSSGPGGAPRPTAWAEELWWLVHNTIGHPFAQLVYTAAWPFVDRGRSYSLFEWAHDLTLPRGAKDGRP